MMGRMRESGCGLAPLGRLPCFGVFFVVVLLCVFFCFFAFCLLSFVFRFLLFVFGAHLAVALVLLHMEVSL